ncbi:GNAT family N-acetyltransferase [Kutzneria chonburiensis]|uniref:GNAT family N-acetyltransferase n=1 Tax=Kutzneria chonburiensis TaxID=1483604 RepID=A0ABV6N5G4_9PSEU|nr:GNAT family N-acetyltransferase [Kutzneria chonburiensis]
MTVFRPAEVEDADRIAELHADSWQRFYRGAYADSFLDGDVVANRREVWSARLASPAGSATVVAEQDDLLVGFVHVIFDADPKWGSLVDNLHVRHDQRGSGLGRRLLCLAAEAVGSRPLYLWVLEQNVAAQGFYRAYGGISVETAPVSPPGGDPTRLNGSPLMLRMVWPEADQAIR